MERTIFKTSISTNKSFVVFFVCLCSFASGARKSNLHQALGIIEMLLAGGLPDVKCFKKDFLEFVKVQRLVEFKTLEFLYLHVPWLILCLRL